MSDKVIPFNKNQETYEECECPSCDLADEYFAYITIAESDEEIYQTIRELINEAKILGEKEFVQRDIEDKVNYLHHLDSLVDIAHPNKNN